MKKIVYSIRFYSDWHCSSGLTSGTDVDSLVIRDQDGLPYIPGKTLKGLLSEAAYILAQVSPDKEEWSSFKRRCFGEQTNKQSDQSEDGVCFFSNGELSQAVKGKLISESQSHFLFRKIASTAIEENGQAKEHSLRKIEVSVPLVLFAEITDCPDADEEKMKKCLQWVKRLGTNRNRGLGRCDMTMKEVV